MNKLVCLVILTLAIPHQAIAQWILQNSFTSNRLYDIEFYDRNTGWAVGDGGTIIKTTNGGTNWNNVPNPAVGKPLSSIHIVDSNVCYVVGWFETIIKSTSGGNDWIVIRNNAPGFGSSYDAVFFVDENTGWIAGTGQKVLRTTNGGDSIMTDPLFTGNIHDMYFKDASTGIITGSGLSTFKTTNGGLNWYNIVMPIGFVIPTFYKISIVNNLLGWVAGSDNRIFKTTDFGDTWDTLSRIALNPQSVSMRFAEFVDDNTGFVGGEQGYLFKTTDGGIEWIRENSGSFAPTGMLSIYLYNDSIGWISGNLGKIIHTTNGGQIMVGISNSSSSLPNEFTLSQNYPNPFNPKTVINYELRIKNFVSLKVYDITGKEVATLVNDIMPAGRHSVEFDARLAGRQASELNSGVYFYSLSVNGEKIETKRMLLLK